MKQQAVLFTVGLICFGAGVTVAVTHSVKAQEGASIPYQGQNEGRYEYFCSPFARADEFLVDTASGDVWQEVKDKDGSLEFQTVPFARNPVTQLYVGRYRIYFSGTTRADTFIIDTQTGIVAQEQADKDGNSAFVKMPVQGLNGAPYK